MIGPAQRQRIAARRISVADAGVEQIGGQTMQRNGPLRIVDVG
jgi:hypothetical protein